MLTPITVTGHIRLATGLNASGQVEFELTAPLLDAAGNVIASVSKIRLSLVAGAFSKVLYATDTPGISPTGVAYRVTENIVGAPERSYQVVIPYNAPGATIDLSDLAPSVTTPYYSYVTETAFLAHVNDLVAHGGGGGGGALSGWTSWALDTRAIARAIGSHCSEHDTISGRTFVALGGPGRECIVTYWDEDGNEGPRVNIGHTWDPVDSGATDPFSDSHGQFAVCVDTDGYVHVLGTHHNSAVYHARSTAPGMSDGGFGPLVKIAGVPPGSYIAATCEQSSGDLYAIYRSGLLHAYQNGGAYPCHECATLIRSTDSGATWTDVNPGIIDLRDLIGDTAGDAYILPGIKDADGKVWFGWQIAHGPQHDGVRGDLYVNYYDPATGHVYTIDGTDLGLHVNWSDRAASRAVAHDAAWAGTAVQYVVSPFMFLERDGTLVVGWWDRLTATSYGLKLAWFQSGAWQTVDVGARVLGQNGTGLRRTASGSWEVFCASRPENDGGYVFDLAIARAPALDGPWTLETLVRRDEVAGVCMDSIVVPRFAADGLKALWQDAAMQFATPTHPVHAITDQPAGSSAVAERLWRPRRRGEELINGASILAFTPVPSHVVYSSFQGNAADIPATCDTGQAKNELIGDWALVNNRAKDNSGNTNGLLAYDPGSDVYNNEIVGVTLQSYQASGCGVAARIKDAGNFLLAILTGTALQINKYDGGVATALGAPAAFVPSVGTAYRVTLECNGSTITAKVKSYPAGAVLATANYTLNAGEITKYTAAGYRLGGCRAHLDVNTGFDDLTIDAAGSSGDVGVGVWPSTYTPIDLSGWSHNISEMKLQISANCDPASAAAAYRFDFVEGGVGSTNPVVRAFDLSALLEPKLQFPVVVGWVPVSWDRRIDWRSVGAIDGGIVSLFVTAVGARYH